MNPEQLAGAHDVTALAVLGKVEANFFFLVRDPQADRGVDELQQDERDAEAVARRRAEGDELVQKQARVAIEQAADVAADPFDGEDADGHCAAEAPPTPWTPKTSSESSYPNTPFIMIAP